MSGSYPYGSSDPSIYDNDPGYYDDEPDDPCDHEEYEIDILTGRAECWTCAHSWHATRQEIEAEIERHRCCDEWYQREERRDRLRALFSPLRRAFAWATSPFRRRDPLADDLPF